MISQSLIHALSDPEAWKCINCGNIISRKEKSLEFDSFTLFHQQQKDKKKNE